MKYFSISLLFLSLVWSSEIINVMEKTSSGFVMKPFEPRECVSEQVVETATGFLYTGRIIWGDPAVNAEVGSPYRNGVVFVSEGKTRAWEYVGKTDENGSFSLSIEPYTQFKLYAWDGSANILAKYDGHFYYNPELDNLYMTPTGGEPVIADKGDVIVDGI